MKGVIWRKAPSAQIADISHNVQFGDIRQAAFLLKSAEHFFPYDTIFIIVVDPGVGSERRALALKQGERIFLAPDNGCLTTILESYPDCEIRTISNPNFMLGEISRTFHGRDVFAAAAGKLAAGGDFREIGETCSDPVTIVFKKFVEYKDRIEAELLYIDSFGNAIINIPSSYDFSEGKWALQTDKGIISLKLCETFSGLKPGKIGLIAGSSGYYEIIMNRESGAIKLSLETGDTLSIIKIGAIR